MKTTFMKTKNNVLPTDGNISALPIRVGENTKMPATRFTHNFVSKDREWYNPFFSVYICQ